MSLLQASEVARLRKAIEEEYVAGQHALYSLAAGSARHEMISVKTQRMGEHFEGLAVLVGRFPISSSAAKSS
jgi:hypothetical protein